ncbi:hypothetical protein [Commensalibacter communis]|uniref:hypothetical protein n=1 Tax=Commensalibacter communis TaxID=2972786 RepID=UPI00232BC522|nr:hypothetical protein [Commensalibacter communis]
MAHISDDTGISTVLLRSIFPYSRFFITTKVDISISFGVFCLIIASITFFIDRDNNIFFFFVFLSCLLFTFALLKFIIISLIRILKPVLTIASFIKTITVIIDEHRDKLTFGISIQDRQIWRTKIYEICSRYKSIFWSKGEFLPALILLLSDPDGYALSLMIEECAEIMSLPFEIIDSSRIYEKYTDLNEDQLLTVVHFEDLLIDFWAENQIKN